MTDEEKKAVDLLNKLNFSCNSYYIVENGLAKDIDYILTRNAIKTIKNLIEKQQKEIDNLTAQANNLVYEYEEEIKEKNNKLCILELREKEMRKEIEEKSKLINSMKKFLLDIGLMSDYLESEGKI